MRAFLVLLASLMMWGPPRLRLAPRPLDLALDQPFDLDASALFQVTVWGLAALAVLFVIGGRGILGWPLTPKFLWSSSLKYYFVYGLLALGSAAYSPSLFYTLFFAGKIIVSVLVVTLLIDRNDLKAQLPLFLKIYLITNVVAWILNVAILAYEPALVGSTLPDVGYRLAGGILEDYGTPAAMAGLYFLSRAMYSSDRIARASSWILYGTSWVFLGLSRTRSSIAGAAVVLFITLLLYKGIRARVFASISFGVALLSLVATESLDAILAFARRGESLEALATLTGRTNAFEYLMTQWKESPWFGLGYGAGTRLALARFVHDTGLGIGSAHDALSKVLVELGVVGTALLLFTFFMTWRDMIRAIKAARQHPHLHPLATQLLGLLCFFTMTNIATAGIAEVSFPFLLVSAGSALILRKSTLSMLSEARATSEAPFAFLPCRSA